VACNDIRIKILVDNNAGAGLVEEHGFSVWLEVSGHRILFDTGQGKALAPNAIQLECDLSLVDTLVLSHGHYDHGGAVSQVLRMAPASRLFCHAGSFLPRYSIRPGEAPRTISLPLPDTEASLGLPGNRAQWVNEPRQIIPDVGISGPIPRVHTWEDTGGPFFLDQEGHHPDPIKDDMAIWMKTDRGLLIITGCCHSGLVNTVKHIRSVTGVGAVFGIIGGLHLLNASRQRLEATCAALREWNPAFVIPCHCTGEGAIAFLSAELGTLVTPGYAGLDWQPLACGIQSFIRPASTCISFEPDAVLPRHDP
jgi:7,8-dihydropterin-6-yl-methyl-4-(beta-D-ribofuranosyl)aminobenzene 5'-phosphate synthase